MPSRPTDRQKVYVEELFFFGQSLRTCQERETERHWRVFTCVCPDARTPRTVLNTKADTRKDTCTHTHLRT